MNTPINSLDCANKFVERSRQNLLALEENLRQLGYEFANADGAVQLADDVDLMTLDELESHAGPLPRLFYKWYETFRCIDFSQSRAQLEESLHDPVAGLGLNCPLVFLDLRSCCDVRDELAAAGYSISREDGGIQIPTGGSASNCMPKGVWVPDSTIDPELYDDGAGPVTMSEEISSAFRSGGFPFWDRQFRRRRFTSPLGHAPSFLEIKPLLLRNLKLN